MAVWRVFAMLIVGLAAACAGAGGGPSFLAGGGEPPRILDLATGRALTESELLGGLRDADFVLLGEEHGTLEHHRLQARLVRALGEPPGRLGAVAFEMLALDRQQAVTEHLAGPVGTSAGLDRAVDWAESGWPDFELYRPVFDAAIAADAEIVAANLTREQVGGLIGEGLAVLPQGLVRRTGLDRPLPPRAARGLSRMLAAAHCDRVSPDGIAGMMRVQRARDALMAERLVTLSGRRPGVLIAGATHVRNDWGVPTYLRRLRPDARIVSIAFGAGGLAVAPAAGDGPVFDYVWATAERARASSYDPCGPLEGSRDGLRTAAADAPR